MKKKLLRLRHVSLVLLIVCLGGFLRFYKLDWGQGFFFHPDEYHIGIAVDRLHFPQEMNPEFFSYGSFTVYLIYFSKVLLTSLNSNFATANPILIGRFYSALFSTVTLFLIYYISAQIFVKKKYALLATLLTALTPGLIQQAHFATPESILTFWLLLTVAFWLKYISDKEARYIIFASASLGAGIATKIVAAVFLPISALLLLLKKGSSKYNLLTKIKYLVLILLTTFTSFFILFPYSILDKSGFLNSMNYETAVAEGKLSVFYTRQFINTTPLVFQLTKVFPYALGLAIFLFGLAGFILTTIDISKKLARKSLPQKKLLVIYFAFLALVTSNGVLFAKWTRFMAPTFPFFVFMAIYLISKLEKNKLVFTLFTLTLTLTTFIWTLMFFSIYKNSDVRITATKWVNQNIPQNSSILTEQGNTLEVPLSGQFRKQAFNFYNLEDKKNQGDLLPLLVSSDYFIVQSRRVFINHQRLMAYPTISSLYNKLFSGQLGFTEIARFSSYPSLRLEDNVFEIDDELAEETWSVFDHPVIRIYQKTKSLTSEDYSRLLNY